MTVRLSKQADQEIKLITHLKQMGPYSSTQIKSLLQRGLCSVNGQKERFGSRLLAKNDLVVLEVHEERRPLFRLENILYEDEELLAYNKEPFSSSEEVEEQMSTYKKNLKLLHRLDRETSGVLLFAKKNPGPYVDLFRKRQVAKGYVALVDGLLKENEGLIDKPLGVIERFEGQVLMGISPQGLPAVTRYKVKKRLKTACLIVCFPVSGRTHQIRVHMLSIGHPLLGDYHYAAKFRSPVRPDRVMLHASFLSIAGRLIKAPLPEDIKRESRHC